MTNCTSSDITQPMAKQMTKPLRRVSQLRVDASDIYVTNNANEKCQIIHQLTATLFRLQNVFAFYFALYTLSSLQFRILYESQRRDELCKYKLTTLCNKNDSKQNFKTVFRLVKFVTC